MMDQAASIGMPPSETDPLLPQGVSAPEISGYGFSRRSHNQNQKWSEVIDQVEDGEDKGDGPADQTDGRSSPLRTIVALFTIVVGLALFITLLIPGTWDAPWQAPGDDGSAFQARVDKILKENPLIGLWRLHTHYGSERV